MASCYGAGMGKRATIINVHIWQIEFCGKVIRATSTDGIHTWISWDDFVEVADIPNPKDAIVQLDLTDLAEFIAKSSPEESRPLRFINEIAVYTLLGLFPFSATDEFKSWFLQIRKYFFQLEKSGGMQGYRLQ
jgi:prophage antirepressor-like protein